ncbi:hypothetical protein [Streptococcus loxodontisalivarius]|uniref:Uncharacterized protein n=1 Tax=Streptococcus loxodontisalivarius TaxID=1349415 RepID=A0ABS2PSR1_9STRE|nr:hypothetical protein [Streptococcus loxodontisalivarius]MBM7642968.1 hypothetical protein [Streptococcus loxodontisalivarius]
MLIVIFLLLHVILVAYTLHRVNVGNLYLDTYLMLLLIFFPILGAVAVFWITGERGQLLTRKELRFEEVIPWMADTEEVVEVQEEQFSEFAINHIVPFREALLINSSGIRRELIIDVIFESPERFVSLLHTARLNDDVEVVHYATTILSELTAKYDGKLHHLERQAKQDASYENQIAYLDFLESYINSHIAEGHYGQQLRQQYIDRVQQLIQQGRITEKRFFLTLANFLLEDRNSDGLASLLIRMEMLYPFDEETCLISLQKLYLENNQAELATYLEEIKAQHVYFSSENRSFVNSLIQSQKG